MAYEPISKYVTQHVKSLVFRRPDHRELIQELIALEQHALLGESKYEKEPILCAHSLETLRKKHPGAYEQMLEELDPKKYEEVREQAKARLGTLLPPISELEKRLATRITNPKEKELARQNWQFLQWFEEYWIKSGGLI